MRLSIVSDIHGNIDALKAVARDAEQLIVLGDLLDYVDYHDPSGGILGRVFGERHVRQFTALRSAGDFHRLREFNRSLWDSTTDPHGTLADVVSTRYREVLAAVGPDTLLTLGNVDVAGIWTQVAGDTLPYLDGQVVQLHGYRLGFVAGGSSRPGFTPRPGDTALPADPVWKPLVRLADDYESAVRALGPVDMLCSHVPPRIPVLRYDVIPARMEMYGPGLLEAIDEFRPRWSVFGHVHQPISMRTRRGRTECVNVGHFQRRPQAFEITLT